MTTCAIVQSSYIPWRGYFDLIRKADVFVFLDHVQYTRQDWRNRNAIKTQSGLLWLTVPVHDDNRLGSTIADVKIDKSKNWAQKHVRSIAQAYAKAPHCRDVLPHLDEIYTNYPEFLYQFNRKSIKRIWELFSGGISKNFVEDESLEMSDNQAKDERLIEICKKLGADHYISGPSAKNYIQTNVWESAGIHVDFMEYQYPPYPQLHGQFETHVSVIDTLMNLGLGCMNEALRG